MKQVAVAIRLCRSLGPEWVPQYMSPGASGVDLKSALNEPVVLAVGERKLIPTGISISLPPGYEAQVRPRSGLAIQHGVTMANTPGTIDSDYRGEIQVIMINLGQAPFVITPAMRIAQMIIAETVKANFNLVEELDETVRSSKGFGHTGTH
jgi:dUTP pyrophosphatase